VQVESYEELAKLFSEDNNQLTQRELLQREGTAKVAEVTLQSDKFLPRLLQRSTNAPAPSVRLLMAFTFSYTYCLRTLRLTMRVFHDSFMYCIISSIIVARALRDDTLPGDVPHRPDHGQHRDT
jgi:hypothetical protein